MGPCNDVHNDVIIVKCPIRSHPSTFRAQIDSLCEFSENGEAETQKLADRTVYTPGCVPFYD